MILKNRRSIAIVACAVLTVAGCGHETKVTRVDAGLVTDLSGRLLASTRADLAAAEVAQVFQDTPQFTWGLQASGVSSSPFTGEGIKVAVLDTGFTFNHPDFAGRNITAQSFVPGVATADEIGRAHV